MGCWNHTCAITNLPIFYRDPVIVLLLERQDSNNLGRYCFEHSYYVPLPLFFEGEYNDYGAVENCHGPLLPDIIEKIRKELVEFETGKNPYHDIAVKKADFSVDLLFKADHENRLFVKGLRDRPARLEHIVIKKDVIDKILKEQKFEVWRLEKREVSFEDMRAKGEEWIAHLKTLDESMRWSWAFGHKSDFNLFTNWTRELFNYSSIHLGDLIIRAIEKSDDTKLSVIIKQMMTMIWLSALMKRGRRPWCVPCGKGSQNESTDAQRLLAKIILEEAEKIDRRLGEGDADAAH
jgi:hypothetical protein